MCDAAADDFAVVDALPVQYRRLRLADSEIEERLRLFDFIRMYSTRTVDFRVTLQNFPDRTFLEIHEFS